MIAPGDQVPDATVWLAPRERTTVLVERGGTVRGAWRHDPGEVPDFDELLTAARAL